MFLLELTYTADLSKIDAAGHFLVSGRKIPRDGGIILATGTDRAAIEAIAAEDPFVTQGLATARVVEFRASQKAKDVERWNRAT